MSEELKPPSPTDENYERGLGMYWFEMHWSVYCECENLKARIEELEEKSLSKFTRLELLEEIERRMNE